MVYVDDMRAPYRGMIMCHMVADSDEELHAMAAKIGVQRKWHQKAGTHQSHYDICLSKKDWAIRQGAVQINRKELGAMLRRRFETGQFGPPAEAVEWFEKRGDHGYGEDQTETVTQNRVHVRGKRV